jgi:hypothetical protein
MLLVVSVCIQVFKVGWTLGAFKGEVVQSVFDKSMNSLRLVLLVAYRAHGTLFKRLAYTLLAKHFFAVSAFFWVNHDTKANRTAEVVIHFAFS